MKTYKRGDKFKINNTEFLLSLVDDDKMCLIDLVDGNRWKNPITVSNPMHVTTEEVLRMSGSIADVIKNSDGTLVMDGNYSWNDLLTMNPEMPRFFSRNTDWAKGVIELMVLGKNVMFIGKNKIEAPTEPHSWKEWSFYEIKNDNLIIQ